MVGLRGTALYKLMHLKLMYLKQVDSSAGLDHYARSFEAIWAGAPAWKTDQKGTPANGQD